MIRFLRVALTLVLVVMTSAHVGSPNAFYSGKAGPYQIEVVVRPPTVVPGVAEVIVHSADERVRVVNVRPVFWRAGSKGAPRGDDAKRVVNQAGTWSAQLWMMQSGSYSVEVSIQGTGGAGLAMIPVAAVPTGQLALSQFLRILLVALGTLLVAGTITAIHAAAGESQLAPGMPMTPHHVRQARRAAIVAVPMLTLILFGGARWWSNEAERYRRSLAKPLSVTSRVIEAGGVSTLEQIVTDPAWRASAVPVMADHGKMAHMFVIGVESPFAFAHLHPAMPDPVTMRAVLPPLPAGRYRVFTDVVDETGLQRTLVDSVTFARSIASGGLGRLEGDEAWSLDAPVEVGRHAVGRAPEGGVSMQWAGGHPVYAERPGVLHISTLDASGNPVVAEPYLGMAGHAVVVREDGKVFVHLHPTGTTSTASVTAFALRNRGDTTATGRLALDRAAHMEDGSSMMMQSDTVRALDFPYAFPSAGRYRVYVQMRVNGLVHTTAFDVDVRPGPQPIRK